MPAQITALDLFAGPLPGGWDCGARSLGLDPLGIEWDDAACQTREAAGLRTLQADVAALDPADFAPCDLLIASPPCQAWSMAGKRQGQEDIEKVYELTRAVAGQNGHGPSEWEWADDRSRLVTEPLRWALALRPTYLAWEQVPPVLDYWRFCADILRDTGYSVWVGVLSAERFGVAQTRKRAILMASLDGPVEPPRPTHQAYVSGEPAWSEPMVTLEGEVKPWVSMSTALGWDAPVNTDRSAAPTGYLRTRGEGMSERHGKREARPPSEPAPTLTEKARSDGWEFRAGGAKMDNNAARKATQPAPTIAFGNDSASAGWTRERPATAVCADPRIFEPDFRGRPEDYKEDGSYVGKRAGDNAIRVTVTEAAVLQGFPPDYPWQGSRTKQFQQIGNAVPPPLAEAVLSALLERKP